MDTVELKLPVSGKVVVIRNYTTRNDDERAEKLLYVGVEAKQNSKDGTNLTLPLANVMASQAAYIPRLVTEIDGDSSNILIRLGDLRSKDYEAIETKVDEIVEENSPKAKPGKSGSKNSTKEI